MSAASAQLQLLPDHTYAKGWLRFLVFESTHPSERIWIQGIVVAVESPTTFFIDDGTGVIPVDVTSMSAYDSWSGKIVLGQSLQALGRLVNGQGQLFLDAVKLVDVSTNYEQEAAFHLDVVSIVQQR